MQLCPCGSGKNFSECCQPIINGTLPAATPEQLMRARYSAYVTAAVDFLYNSTHPDHRADYDHKGTEEWAKNAHWLGLEIRDTQGGGEQDTTGTVEFVAHYVEKGIERHHHEEGSFLRDTGVWTFTEGKMVTNKPIVRTAPKVGRNDPCPCGSTLKFKKCCGR